MPIRSRYNRDYHSFYDDITSERVLIAAPVTFYDDFLGKALDTNVWGTRDTAGATEAYKGNAGNGVLELALTSTNEAQLGGVDWADQRPLVLNQRLIFRSRFRFTVLPTGSVIACVGLCGAHNAVVDTVAESIWFRLDGNGNVTVEHDDTAHESTKVATGITLLVNTWIYTVIDCTDPANVQFFINGNRVASGTTFDMSTVAALALQPVARIGKEAAATTVGTLEVDFMRLQQSRG